MEGIFTNALSIIAALLLLGVFVTLHEFGHFIVARRLGFRILEFAVGMGPKLYAKEKNGILFSLRALPIGGMCRFPDEDDGQPGRFQDQAVWKRMLVVVAGPVLNVVTALLLGVIILMGYGVYTNETQVRIVEVTDPGSPAAVGGVEPGDVIHSIDGAPISNQEEALAAINAAAPASMTLTVERDGALLDLSLKNLYDEAEGRNLLGISIMPYYLREKLGFFQAVGSATNYLFMVVQETFSALGRLFTGQAQQGDVGGVVAIVATVSTAVRTNFEMVLQIAMLLSISLGIMNLLPVPALDGGRLVFLLIEAVRGKPVSPEKEGMVHFIGFALLMVLMVVLVFSDIRMLSAG